MPRSPATNVDFTPEYLPHDISAPRFNIQARPGMFGGLIAQGLTGAGEKIAQGAKEFGAVALEKQNLDNETFANSAAVDITGVQAKEYEDYTKHEGQAAAQGIDDFKQKLEKNYQTALANAPNERARAMIARQARYVTDQYIRSGTTYAAAQGRKWSEEAAGAKRDTMANQALLTAMGVLHSEDPNMTVETYLRGSDDAVKQYWQNQVGAGPEKAINEEDQKLIDRKIRENRGANQLAIIKAMKDDPERGPVAANDYFKQHVAEMDEKSQVSAMNELRAGLNQVAGQAKADIAMNRGVKTMVDRVAGEFGIDPKDFATLIHVESNGDPNAIKGSYHGLGQLSHTEFQTHGGTGNIYDPLENLRATARKYIYEKNKFMAEHDGREPTFLDLYMIHQQGEGGYARHTANPDLPAWMNMYNTAEGRRKGEGWAKQAIWGNISDDGHRKFGSVENVTSRDFFAYWNAKLHGDSASFLPDRAVAFERIQRETEGNPAQRAAAEAQMNRVYSVYEGQKTAQLASFNTKLRDSVSEALNTGTVKDQIPKDDFYANFPNRDEAEAQYQDYQDNIQYGADLKAVPLLNDQQQNALLAERAVPPGPGFEQRQKRYDKLEKIIKATQGERQSDPAESVKEDEAVKAAAKQAQDSTTASYQALVNARLAAQRRLGIEEPSPITNDEALKMTVPMERMLPGQEMAVMQQMQEKFQQLYGENAPEAWAYAMRARKISAEMGKVAFYILQKMQKGERPADDEARAADSAEEQRKANLVGTGWYSDDTIQYGNSYYRIVNGDMMEVAPPTPVVTAPKRPYENIPQPAIKTLLADPKLADDFNKIFGDGKRNVAKEILDKYNAQAELYPNIPPTAIKDLIADPSSAATFNKLFGQGKDVAKDILSKVGQ